MKAVREQVRSVFMRKKRRMPAPAYVAILAALCALVVNARAQEAETNAPAIKGPDLWFPVGEELVYEVNWGYIPIGYARITTQWVQEGGRTLLAIRYRARSNKVIATLYPVDDKIESIIDPLTFLPIRFTKNLREGRHRYHEITTFDYDRLKAKWTSLIKKKSKEYDIEPDTRDLVTFMYYMRSKKFRSGEKRRFRVMADEKIYDLYVNAKSTEKIKVGRFGKIPCMRFDPKAKFQGLFVRKGRLYMWASQDKRRICTQVKAKLPVASVRVQLDAVYGPGDDLWTRKSKKKKKKKK